MSGIFGSEYAGTYDVLYKDKDYARGMRFIDRVLQVDTPRPPVSEHA